MFVNEVAEPANPPLAAPSGVFTVSRPVEPVAEKPVVKRVIRKSGSSFTPSITDALNGRHSGENKQENALDTLKYHTENELEEPFTREQFEQKWKEFISRYEERPNLYTALSNIPHLEDDYKLLLTIGSATIDEEIKIIKPDLVSWLRKELRNSRIEMVTKVDVQKLKRVIYSDSEKLQEMINKNPQLSVFRQKFNLDFNE
ncbi:MAG: hypothetical protein RBS73_01075 [Prolixibacteraceae bacterium]|nr:hypothetical protein [Prolixibacteraceae bacterium]